jgi:hypothetical protein
MMAPKLSETYRLQAQHRPLFAMFCVYYAEWVRPTRILPSQRPTQTVPTVAAGGSMERIRPIVKIRDQAFDQVLKLSARFGLTPTDEYALFKEQQIAAGLNPGLFDHAAARRDAARPRASRRRPSSVVGISKTLDSPPPKHLQLTMARGNSRKAKRPPRRKATKARAARGGAAAELARAGRARSGLFLGDHRLGSRRGGAEQLV